MHDDPTGPAQGALADAELPVAIASCLAVRMAGPGDFLPGMGESQEPEREARTRTRRFSILSKKYDPSVFKFHIVSTRSIF